MIFIVLLLALVVMPAESQPQWKMLASPTSRNLNKVCFIDSVEGWVAGDTGTILHTSNAGNSWTGQNPGIRDDIKELFMLDRRFGWAVAMRYDIDSLWFGSVLLKTSDGGLSWSSQLYRDEYFSALSFQDSTHGWMGGAVGELLRTSDGGLTWAQALVDSSIWMQYPVLKFRFLSTVYGFAMGGHIDRAGVVWRTTNGGDRWTSDVAAGEPVRDLHFVDSLHLVAIGGDFENGPAIVLSSDGGLTWTEHYLNLVGEVRAMSFRTPNEAWVALGILGQYMVTTDTGSTWTTFSVPDSAAALDLTFADSLHGYMVGTKGIILRYKPTIAGIAVSRTAGTSPSFMLEQNYPNPFNPSTTIRYTIPTGSHVRLVMYNTLGQKVAVIVDDFRTAGSHEEVWTPDLPSGVYFCRLEAQGTDEPAGRFLQAG